MTKEDKAIVLALVEEWACSDWPDGELYRRIEALPESKAAPVHGTKETAMTTDYELLARAREMALHCAYNAIHAAITHEDGLDGDKGAAILRIIVAAIEHGPFEGAADVSPFLASDRAIIEQLQRCDHESFSAAVDELLALRAQRSV